MKTNFLPAFVRDIKKIVVSFLILITLPLLIITCGKKPYPKEIKQTPKISNKNITVEYPDEISGNYISLNDSIINMYSLSDQMIKDLQFYTSENIKLYIYKNNKSTKSDTVLVNSTLIEIPKFTPCIILRKIETEKEFNIRAKKEFEEKTRKLRSELKAKLEAGELVYTGKHSNEYVKDLLRLGQPLPGDLRPIAIQISINDGYLVDVGNHLVLGYTTNPFIYGARFTSVEKYNNKKFDGKYKIVESSSLIFNESLLPKEKIMKIINKDTLKVSGTRLKK